MCRRCGALDDGMLLFGLLPALSGLRAAEEMFLTSAGLLEAGLRSMAWRYGLAALVGYGVFLLGLRLWLILHARRRSSFEDVVDAVDLVPTSGACLKRLRGVCLSSSSGVAVGSVARALGARSMQLGGGSGATSVADVASDASGSADVADAVGALDEGAALVIHLLVAGFILVGFVGVVTVLVGSPWPPR